MIFKGKYKNIRMITWNIIKQCNFNCSYCFRGYDPNRSNVPIDISKLKKNLDLLSDEWLFYITGGEPFLEKDIIEVCQAITRRHYLSINTNLSLNKVFEFADKIDPKRTLSISAAVHIVEREKRDLKLKSYIEKICYLQNKGFNIIASYVVSPDLLTRIKQDLEYLKSSGVQKARIKVFRGIYNGKYYPNAFNIEEKELIKSLESDYPEIEILLKNHNFHGHQCRAGKDFFIMERNGDLKRCSNILRSYGNFIESTMVSDGEARPCPAKHCGCPYEGIRNVMDMKGSYSSLLLEEGNQIYLESKKILLRIIEDPKSLKKVRNKVIEYFAK
jgi:MoaA/NifB/PqqE/SkfB family radical SAM enzyme